MSTSSLNWPMHVGRKVPATLARSYRHTDLGRTRPVPVLYSHILGGTGQPQVTPPFPQLDRPEVIKGLWVVPQICPIFADRYGAQCSDSLHGLNNGIMDMPWSQTFE
ncbi:hypothetical protein JMJ77_0007593 [Colletotrichum scovillei]|uniref:Uncharacterized protein n=1 Tax=Colletotrichum scovillei TaxID=1209932 RepID=A0A9P7RFK5_9PEZI|nr:hypothetical protein JMJ77_0007593 [Colletotrichum scovillei]KAG7074605.1 hypothetical protein JMJ76_0011081 [Colletotrichum scovillei]